MARGQRPPSLIRQHCLGSSEIVVLRLGRAMAVKTLNHLSVVAEQVGLDFFGIGAHHTDEFPMHAPTSGWEAVADYALSWAVENATATA